MALLVHLFIVLVPQPGLHALDGFVRGRWCWRLRFAFGTVLAGLKQDGCRADWFQKICFQGWYLRKVRSHPSQQHNTQLLSLITCHFHEKLLLCRQKASVCHDTIGMTSDG